MPVKSWRQVILFSSLQTLKETSISKLQYYSHHFLVYSSPQIFQGRKQWPEYKEWRMLKVAPKRNSQRAECNFFQFFVITKTSASKTRQAKVWGFSPSKKIPKLIQFCLILMGSWKDISSLKQEQLLSLNTKMVLNIYSHRKKYIKLG